ncbi:MAG: DEAD/DEAH box helicase [Conexivisphaerales archaeon]|jgi:ATP-dependent Lhr-like helicase
MAADVALRVLLSKAGIESPTSIQTKTWPIIIRRKNSLVCAPTGSGKTEAVMIPVLVSMAASRKVPGIRALYVTPLRALNRDLLVRLTEYAEAVGLKAAVRHGDSPESARRKTLTNPPDLLITTPETLGILLSSKKFKENLRTVEWVVIDEVHELVNSKRGAHLAISLERLAYIASKPPVRVGVSATIGNLDLAAKFILGAEGDYAIIVDPVPREYEIEPILLDGDFRAVASYVLKDMVGKNYGTSLVFANTRDEVEIITALMKEKNELSVGVHHGSLSKEIREDVERALKGGKLRVVVSTSSLELGLDIGDIDHVYQINSPRQVTKLAQRIGRSFHEVGHRAGGTVLCTDMDNYVESLALIRRLKEGSIEKIGPLDHPLDVLAHHIVGTTIERGRYSGTDFLTMVREAYQYSDLDSPTFDDVVTILAGNYLVWHDGPTISGRGKKTYEFYFSNVSMIPEVENYEVVELMSRKKIGFLDERFVAENMEQNQSVILHGEPWRVVSIDDQEAKVFVERTKTLAGAIPIWTGEMMPVECETARMVGRIRNGSSGEGGELAKYHDRILEELGVIPDEDDVIIEVGRGGAVIHSCFGTKINSTLEKMVSAMIRGLQGGVPQSISDAYRILVLSQPLLSGERLRDLIMQVKDLEAVTVSEIISYRVFQYAIWQVAKRFGVIDRTAKYDRRAAKVIMERYRQTPVYVEALNEVLQRKYDIAGAKNVLEKMQDGRIRIGIVNTERYSVLSSRIVDDAIDRGVEGPEKAVEKLKERLSVRHVKLVCLTCGKWSSVIKAFEAQDKFRCKLCGSRMIAITSPYDIMTEKVAEKRVKKKRLAEDEDKRFRKAWKSASLGMSFGRKAAIAMSCYGVGEDTAGRILRQSVTEEDMFLQLYYAERNFLLYRQYWDN